MTDDELIKALKKLPLPEMARKSHLFVKSLPKGELTEIVFDKFFEEHGWTRLEFLSQIMDENNNLTPFAKRAMDGI
jgi:hypothetical protein